MKAALIMDAIDDIDRVLSIFADGVAAAPCTTDFRHAMTNQAAGSAISFTGILRRRGVQSCRLRRRGNEPFAIQFNCSQNDQRVPSRLRELRRSKMKRIPYAVRQGDVLLVDAAYRGGIPAAAAQLIIAGDTILAHGEVTGHAHRIKAESVAEPVKYFDRQAERYLLAVCEAPLTHEEHGTIPILPRKGGYQQAFQVEDFGEEVRRVQD